MEQRSNETTHTQTYFKHQLRKLNNKKATSGTKAKTDLGACTHAVGIMMACGRSIYQPFGMPSDK